MTCGADNEVKVCAIPRGYNSISGTIGAISML